MGRVERAVILLAEDDPAQREVLEEVLTYEGFRVLLAEDSQQVVAQLSENPDIVLMDVIGVLSPQVSSAIAAMARPPAVLMVSGHHSLEKIAERVHADAFLPKPYELEPLLTTLGQLLERRRSGVQAPAICSG